MKDELHFRRTTTTRRQIEMTGDDLLDLLAARDPAFKDYKYLVRRVWIRVPSGADYSGMDLDITAQTPIIITIERTHEEKGTQ